MLDVEHKLLNTLLASRSLFRWNICTRSLSLGRGSTSKHLLRATAAKYGDETRLALYYIFTTQGRRSIFVPNIPPRPFSMARLCEGWRRRILFSNISLIYIVPNLKSYDEAFLFGLSVEGHRYASANTELFAVRPTRRTLLTVITPCDHEVEDGCAGRLKVVVTPTPRELRPPCCCTAVSITSLGLHCEPSLDRSVSRSGTES